MNELEHTHSELNEPLPLGSYRVRIRLGAVKELFHISKSKAQAFVEFALVIPILLLLIFGIIEFGRLLFAYLALENGARFAIRYASTGNYNAAFCEQAGQVLGLKVQDYLDGAYDCNIPIFYPGSSPRVRVPDAEENSSLLQDWARLPSVREAALAGATGIAWDPDPAVSGDYIAYLSNAGSVLSQDYRGNPGAKGYFNMTACSNRFDPEDHTAFQFNPNPFYYEPHPAGEEEQYRFPEYCQQINTDTGQVVRYIDDVGGPGNRVRIVLTYRHNLITPLISNWWPTVRLTAVREGVVEQFRTSRVVGLADPIVLAHTYTPRPHTPTNTLTPTITRTPTITPTRTATATATSTPLPNCNMLVVSPSESLRVKNNRDLEVFLYNTSLNYSVTLTGTNGTWLTDWHAAAGESKSLVPQVREYGWNAGGYSTFYTLPTAQRVSLSSPGTSWNHDFGTVKVIEPNWSGYFVTRFQSDAFKKQTFVSPDWPTYSFVYYHGSDFRITVRYTIGGLSCSQTVTGLQGPVIQPTVIASGSTIAVDAGASAARGMDTVFFTVFNSSGVMVHKQQESSPKYCIFGGDNPCTTRRIYLDTWSTGAVIEPGTYTVSIIARDAGVDKYSTRVEIPLVVQQVNTPTLTRTVPTRTATATVPTPTRTATVPTRTFTATVPSRTPTATVPSRTPTRTSTATVTPVNTITPTTTITPTPTLSLTPKKIG